MNIFQTDQKFHKLHSRRQRPLSSQNRRRAEMVRDVLTEQNGAGGAANTAAAVSDAAGRSAAGHTAEAEPLDFSFSSFDGIISSLDDEQNDMAVRYADDVKRPFRCMFIRDENFTLNLIAVLILLTALCVNLIAGERIIPWTDDSIGKKAPSTIVQKDTIHLSDKNTTHIRFDSDIKYVDLSNHVLVAKIVDGNKDIVAVKAREPFDFSTSMSCLEADGDMHSFIIVYDENPANLIIDRRNVRPNGVVEDYFAESKDGISAEGSSTQNVNPFDIEDLKYAKQDFYHVGAHCYDIEKTTVRQEESRLPKNCLPQQV